MAAASSVNIRTEPSTLSTSYLLFNACGSGNLKVVQQLLENPQCNVLALDTEGNTPLHIAARNGHLSVVQELAAKHGQLGSTRNNLGQTPLHVACAGGKTEVAKVLASLFSAEVQAKDNHGDTPLHLASLWGHEAVFDLLCTDFRCNPNSKGAYDRTPLHHACSGGHVNLVRKLILQYNCDPAACGDDGNAPIHCAAYYGHSDLLFMLLRDFNCPVKLRGFHGTTLLHQACGGGHLALARRLMSEYGFDPREKKSDGKTALHCAALLAGTSSQSYGDPLAQYSKDLHNRTDFNHLETIKALITEYNCPVDCTDNDGLTPLHSACIEGQNEAALMFIREFGCDPMAVDRHGNTALHCAVMGGQEVTAKMLITECNCSVDCVNYELATPLHIACIKGHTKMVETLVFELGANPQLKDLADNTPLTIATHCGHKNIVTLLTSEYTEVLQSKASSVPPASLANQQLGVQGVAPPTSATGPGMFQAVHMPHTGVQQSTGLAKLLLPPNTTPNASYDNNYQMARELHYGDKAEETHGRELPKNVATPVNVANVPSIGNVQVQHQAQNMPRQHMAGGTPLAVSVPCYSPQTQSNSASNVDAARPLSLHDACIAGNIQQVRALLQKSDRNPMSPDKDGNTPLHLAAQHGHLPIVEELLGQESASSAGKNHLGQTPLHLASEKGHKDIVRVLASKFPFHLHETYKNSPLHLAALQGHTDVVCILCDEFNCDPNEHGEYGWNTLHFACAGGHIQTVVTLIQQYNCNPMVDINGCASPFFCAVLFGHIELMSRLIEEFNCSVYINAELSILTCACAGGHTSIVQKLISEYGCDPKELDEAGISLLHVAAIGPSLLAEMPQPAFFSIIKPSYVELIKALITEYKCPADLAATDGMTPLHCACQSGSIDIVQVLITEFRCDPLACNHQGQMSTHFCALGDSTTVLKLLVKEYNCPVDSVDFELVTPLHIACGLGHINTVKVLILDLGANLNALDIKGNTPRDVAIQERQAIVTEFLTQLESTAPTGERSQRMQSATNVSTAAEEPNSANNADAARPLSLHDACIAGNIQQVRALLQKSDRNPMAPDKDGNTPLHLATQHGHLPIVEELLSQASALSAGKNHWGQTPLHLASEKGHKDIVRVLASKFPFHLHETYKNSPLHLAALQGHTDVVCILCDEFNCDPNRHGEYGWNTLHFACAGGRIQTVVTLIQQYNCSPMAGGTMTVTPFFLAVFFGHTELMTKLIEEFSCNVHINVKHSILRFACSGGHAAILRKLVSEYGCDPKERNETGMTLLHLAATGSMILPRIPKRPDDAFLNILTPNYAEVVRVLITEYNCPAECTTPEGNTPLHAACQSGNIDVVRVLIAEFKCDPLACNDRGQNSTHQCAFGDNTVAMKLLVKEYNCPVDSVDFHLVTPLHIACSFGHINTVKVLILELGANPKVQDIMGTTPLDVAIEKGQTSVVEILTHLDSTAIIEEQSQRMQSATNVSIAAAANSEVQTPNVPDNVFRGNRFQTFHKPNEVSGRGQPKNVATPVNVANVPSIRNVQVQHQGGTASAVSVPYYSPQAQREAANSASNVDAVRPLSLHNACIAGNIQQVRALLQKSDHNPMAPDKDGNTPLHLAAQHGHLPIVEELLSQASASSAGKNHWGQTPLHLASEKGHKEIVRVLASKFPFHLHETYKNSPLHLAALQGYTDVVCILCDEFNCDPNEHGEYGWNTLHFACAGGHTQLVEKLIFNYNCNPTGGVSAETPFICAVFFGHVDLVSKLINEFNCSVLVNGDHSLVHYACNGGHLNMLRKLILDFGCDPKERVVNDLSLLHVTAMSPWTLQQRQVFQLGSDDALFSILNPNYAEIIRALITEFNLSPLSATPTGQTPLHYACQACSIDVVRVLIDEFKCDPLGCDHSGRNATHYCAFGDSIAVIKLLVREYKCPVDAVDFELLTPLHIACGLGHTNFIKALIFELGANPHLLDLNGNTPKTVAAQNGHDSVVEFLTRLESTATVEKQMQSQRMRSATDVSTTAANPEQQRSRVPESASITEKQSYKMPSAANSRTEAVNKPEEQRTTVPASSLYAACKIGDVSQVKIFLKAQATDLFQKDEDGNTPLHIAAKNGHLPVVEMLMSKYSSIGDTLWNSSGQTPLHLASIHGCPENVLTLGSCFPSHIEAKDNHGDIPLHLASLWGREDIVRLLCEKFNCNPHSRGYQGRTCLHYACSGGHPKLVSTLVSEYGCEVQARDETGNGTIHHAAYYGHAVVLEKLVHEHGCPLDMRGSNARTVVHFTASGGHWKLLQKLISLYGCDPLEPEGKGNNALHSAAEGSFPYPSTRINPREYLHDHGFFHNTDDLSHIDTIRMLITEYNCPVDSRNVEDETPLACALREGDPEVVDVLVKEFNCSLNERFYSNRTALHYVCMGTNVELIDKLVSEHGFDLMSPDVQGATPLHAAALHGQEKSLRKLISLGCPPDIRAVEGHTPLHCAAQNGHVNIVRILISEFGCDPMAIEQQGGTPLHQAATSARTEVMKVLVKEFNCPVDCVSFSLLTPLHLACVKGDPDCVRVLLHELGANPNMRDIGNNTPLDLARKTGQSLVVQVLATETGGGGRKNMKVQLDKSLLHVACERGDYAKVENLISLGCDPMAKDDDGYTPLHMAARAGASELVERLVIAYQCNPLARSNNGDTPLHLAVANRQGKVVDVLIKLRCDPTLPGSLGRTPIHIACFCGDVAIVRKLVSEYKVDPMVIDNDGNTTLHVAALSGRTEIVRFLIRECNCSPFAKNKESKTPLGLAEEKSHQECIAELLQYSPGKCIPQKPIILPKLLIIGSHSTGKSTLLEALKNPSPQPISKPSRSYIHLAQLVRGAGEVAIFELPSSPYLQAALTKRLLSSSSGVVILTVDLRSGREELIHQLASHICMLSYNSPGLDIPPRVLIVGSHADCVHSPAAQDLLSQVYIEVVTVIPDQVATLQCVGHFALNCLQPRSAEMQAVRNCVGEATSAFTSENIKTLSPSALELFKLLKEVQGRPIVSATEVTQLAKMRQIYQPDQFQHLPDYTKDLDTQGLVLTIPEPPGPESRWLVLDPGFIVHSVANKFQSSGPSLASKDNATLPVSFGMIAEQEIAGALPDLNQLATVECLKQLCLCEEVKNPAYVFYALGIRNPKLQSLVAGRKKWLFCPFLLEASRTNRHWKPRKSNPFHKGICIQPAKKMHSFPQMFAPILLLDVASNLVFPSLNAKQCSCEVWKDGIQWTLRSGLEALVEVTEEGRILLVARGSELGCDHVLSAAVSKALSSCFQHCRSLHVESYLIHPDDINCDSVPTVERCHLLPLAEIQRVLKQTGILMDETSLVTPYSKLSQVNFWSIIFPVDSDEVLQYLQCHADNWYRLGIALRVPENVLGEIEQAHHVGATKCLERVIKEWILVTPAWSSLVRFLQETQMDDTATTVISNHEEEMILQTQLFDPNKANTYIDDIFLHMLARVVGERWRCMAPLLSYTAAGIDEVSDEQDPLFSMLQRWAQAVCPTYGYVFNLFQAPLLHGTKKPQKQPYQWPNYTSKVYTHTLIESDLHFHTEEVGTDGKQITWKDLGLTLTFPVGAIPQGQTVRIAACVFPSGRFTLPGDLVPVSAVCAVVTSPEVQFKRQVQLTLKLSAKPRDEKSCSLTTFVVSQQLAQSHVPQALHLQPIQGGQFKPKCALGTIVLDQPPMIVAVAYHKIQKQGTAETGLKHPM